MFKLHSLPNFRRRDSREPTSFAAAHPTCLGQATGKYPTSGTLSSVVVIYIYIYSDCLAKRRQHEIEGLCSTTVMATTTLLDLPTELLDRVYKYIDWDKTKSLTPSRPDIFSVSLTCRHLRQTILPIVFRDVTLKLRWVDDGLLEPALFKIRRDCPHLTRHVRCVYIKTQFGQSRAEQKPKFFDVPEGLQDWLDPAETASDDATHHLALTHRQRVGEVAENLFSSLQYKERLSRCSSGLRKHAESLDQQISWQTGRARKRQRGLDGADVGTLEALERLGDDLSSDLAREEAVTTRSTDANKLNRNECRSLRLELHALVIVILCLPASLKSLIFEALPRDVMDTLQNGLALHITAIAVKIFGNRLMRVMMMTCPADKRRGSTDHPDTYHERTILRPEILGKLEVTKTLVLASQKEFKQRAIWVDQVSSSKRWHVLSPTVTRLELWNLDIDPPHLIELVKGFSNLQDLYLHNMHLHLLGPARRQPGSLWPPFLIELRRLMPGLTLLLRNLQLSMFEEPRQFCPASAVRWLLDEAIPIGCSIDFEREMRLVEDFESFLPLWAAEDSLRGEAAFEARKDGSLVDAAMTSRWQTFANARR